MYVNEGQSSLPIHYRGFHVNDVTQYTRDELRNALAQASELEREILYAIVRELATNAKKHGGGSGDPAEYMVDRDDHGLFVEVASTGKATDVRKLEGLVNKYRLASDQELRAAEIATATRNLNSDKSGIGILQVLRRSMRKGKERAVTVHKTRMGDYARVCIRAYVAH